MKILSVVGARPNFVKIAALIHEMRRDDAITPVLVHTGQHYDDHMSARFFADLEIPPPDANLDVRSGSPATQTAEVMRRLEPIVEGARPDRVVVVGDVNSTLAAALVAVKLGIPVAHVEAGLRSFDRSMPEEINRVVTDAVADDCFTTEPAANENLAREGVSASRIHYVGNVMIDTLFRFQARARRSRILETVGVAERGFAVLTLHRPSNVDDTATLSALLRGLRPIAAELPVVFPVHPRTAASLQRLVAAGGLDAGIRSVAPVGYVDFVRLMGAAVCVLTDSGGIQEETTALGVPCLTLRTTTERPVTTTHGTNRVVGLDAGRIAEAWDEIRAGTWPSGRLPEMWDGKAAERIVRILRGQG